MLDTSFKIIFTSLNAGVVVTSISKAPSLSTSSGLTFTFIKLILFFSTFILTSFDSHITLPFASKTFAKNIFSHSTKFVTSFS